MKKIKGIFIIEIYMLSILAIAAINMPVIYASPAPSLIVETNKPSYYLREKVKIYANLTVGGSPIEDRLIALQVNDIYGAMIYRTLQTGTTPITGDFEVVSIGAYKEIDPYTWIPTDTLEIGSAAGINITIKNVGTVTKSATMAMTVYDGNNIPIGVGAESYFIPPNLTAWTMRPITIPTWAYRGTAIVYVSIFTDFPTAGGIPYCSETSATFNIVRKGAGNSLGTALQTKLSSNPTILETTQTDDSSYSTVFRLSPDPWPGTYTIYASSSYQGEPAADSTTFQVLDVHYPPQASFTYSPPFPIINETIEFDASSSTAEGYGDYIVSYEWNFGDGTPKVTETDPITTHKYTANGTYTVTLNVTDNEGLWCTTSKPVTVSFAYGPKASFTYSPSEPYAYETILFNASLSQPGWDRVTQPIVSYQWNFGDGNITTVTDPIIYHTYTQWTSYTVALKVTDAKGRWDNTSQTINVREPPSIPPTANFTYSPPEPLNGTVTVFDASASLPGWKGIPQPIVNYTWDFGDDTPKVTVTDPIATHIFAVNGTYIVTLNVTDAQGLWNTTSKTLNVSFTSGVHSLSIVSVTPSAAMAFTSWTKPFQINVTIINTGTFTETFNVTVYTNSTSVGYSQTVNNLDPWASITLTFIWDISGIYVPSVRETGTPYPGPPKFLISANISSAVLGEIQAIDGYVEVRHPGDTDADGKCYTLDFSKLVLAYREGTKPEKPFNSPQCDFDGDKKVYTIDFSILVLNFRWGATWP